MGLFYSFFARCLRQIHEHCPGRKETHGEKMHWTAKQNMLAMLDEQSIEFPLWFAACANSWEMNSCAKNRFQPDMSEVTTKCPTSMAPFLLSYRGQVVNKGFDPPTNNAVIAEGGETKPRIWCQDDETKARFVYVCLYNQQNVCFFDKTTTVGSIIPLYIELGRFQFWRS